VSINQPWLRNNYFGFGSADAYARAIQEKIGPNRDWSRLTNPAEGRLFMEQYQPAGAAAGAGGATAQGGGAVQPPTQPAGGGNITQDAFNDYLATAQRLLQPQFDTRRSELDRRLRAIQAEAQGLRGIAEAGHEQARQNLTLQERDQWNRLTQAAAARGLASSPLSAYKQRKVTEAFAPEHRQLEQQAAANLARIAAQAALGMEEFAGQKRALEEGFSAQAAQNALNMLLQDRARQDALDQQQWLRGFQMLERTTLTPSERFQLWLQGADALGETFGMLDEFGNVQDTGAPDRAFARVVQEGQITYERLPDGAVRKTDAATGRETVIPAGDPRMRFIPPAVGGTRQEPKAQAAPATTPATTPAPTAATNPNVLLQQAQAAFGAATTPAEREAARAAGAAARAAGATDAGAQAIWQALRR